MSNKYFILFLCFTPLLFAQSSLDQADSLFNEKKYVDAQAIFAKTLLDEPNNIRALKGLIITLFKTKNYTHALTVSEKYFSLHCDYAFGLKVLYIAARMNDSKRTNTFFTHLLSCPETEKSISEKNRELSNTIRLGLLDGGHTAQAAQWLSNTSPEYSIKNTFAIEQKTSSFTKKTSPLIYDSENNHSLFSGGYTIYNKSYACQSTAFQSITASIPLSELHVLDIGYSHSTTSFKKATIHYPADTIFYGLKIYPPVSEIPPDNKHLIDTVPFIFDGILDTAYYPYDTFRIQSIEQNPGYDAYDTVYSKPYDYDFKPGSKTSQCFFGAYTNHTQFIPYTQLFISGSINRSFIESFRWCNALFWGHMTTISAIGFGSWYGFAATPRHQFCQISPSIRLFNNFGFIQASGTLIKRVKAPAGRSELSLPDLQVSQQLHTAFILPRFYIGTTISSGRRLFLFEERGSLWSIEPNTLLLGIKISVQWQPFTNHIYFFVIGDRLLYKTYNSLTFSGGVLYRW